MIDESTTITDDKYLAIVSKHLLTNSVTLQYLENLIHFGSNGASTMLGSKQDNTEKVIYFSEYER
ncbi:18281_t:CDS:2, partial [Gigaspora rosea]